MDCRLQESGSCADIWKGMSGTIRKLKHLQTISETFYPDLTVHRLPFMFIFSEKIPFGQFQFLMEQFDKKLAIIPQYDANGVVAGLSRTGRECCFR